MRRFFVGMTGASGHAYATRLIQGLVAAGNEVDLCISGAGTKVLRHELGVDVAPGGVADGIVPWLGEETAARVRVFPIDAVEAPASSGTSLTGGVILCPCSMGTLARVVAGFSSNLIERAADVALKEGRPLVVVPRETPLSQIHLENMLYLARMGAVVMPAAPGFYHHPRTVDDLVDHVVGKILDRLGLDYARGVRWKGTIDPPEEEGAPPRRRDGEAR